MTTERRPSPHAKVLPAPYVDAVDWTHLDPPLVTVVFSKHRGRTYPQAVHTAQQAELYKEYDLLGSLHHVAVFSRDGRQSAIALVLLRLTMNLKGTLVFDADGILVQNAYSAEKVLECYQKASLVRDHTAYCHTVISDPFVVRGTFEMVYALDRPGARYVLPCRLINKSYLAFEADHPATPEDLIQVAAVEQGSHWCPHFSASAFRQVDPHIPDITDQPNIFPIR